MVLVSTLARISPVTSACALCASGRCVWAERWWSRPHRVGEPVSVRGYQFELWPRIPLFACISRTSLPSSWPPGYATLRSYPDPAVSAETASRTALSPSQLRLGEIRATLLVGLIWGRGTFCSDVKPRTRRRSTHELPELGGL